MRATCTTEGVGPIGLAELSLSLDRLDRELETELEVIQDELEAALDGLDRFDRGEDDSFAAHATCSHPASRHRGLVLGVALAAVAVAFVWMWPASEPPPFATVPVAAPAPTAVAAPSIESDAAELDRGAIRRAVAEQFVPKARACYNELLRRDPLAQGKVTLRFGVIRDGDRGVVDRCDVDEPGTDMHDPTLRTCLVDAMKAVIFEAPTGEGRVEIVYPVVFRTAKTQDGEPGVIAP